MGTDPDNIVTKFWGLFAGIFSTIASFTLYKFKQRTDRDNKMEDSIVILNSDSLLIKRDIQEIKEDIKEIKDYFRDHLKRSCTK